jgi:hypothetical protein
LLQARGAAGFAVLTEPFADQVQRAVAYYETDRTLPAVVLSHPMQNISSDALEARAVALADAAQRLLRGETDGTTRA